VKAIDLTQADPTLSEVLELAGDSNVVVRTADGREFVVAAIDDFADEVAKTAANPALRRLLSERSQERTRHTPDDVRAKLQQP
jgi:hypothetical protein